MTTQTENLTLENFTERTGSRFRVSKLQAARIALTELTDDVRQSLVGKTEEEVADILSARNKNGQPFNWVEDAVNLLNEGWNTSMELDREGALQEFLADGGLKKIADRRPGIPDIVFLDPDLTLDNFPDKVEALIGVKRRFRVSRDQHARIAAGEITREQALAETVAAKRTDAAKAEVDQPNVFEDPTNE